MAMPRKVERNARMVKLYERGLTQAEIGLVEGVSRQMVGKVLRREGMRNSKRQVVAS